MQDAADIASVGSISVNSKAFKIGLTMGNGVISDGEASDSDSKCDENNKESESECKTQAVGSTDPLTQVGAIFDSNFTPSADLTSVKVDAKVTKVSTLINSDVTVTGTFHPFLLGIFGFNTIPLTVTSKSQASMPPYMDFYLLLDNSPSMGVGATTADINTMVANTSDKCAFACHQMDKPTTDYYSLAKKLGVTTRIDVVRKATQNLMSSAENTETVAEQYRMAIYDFGAAAESIDAKSPDAVKISDLTSDLGKSASDAEAIQLMTIPYQGYNSDRQSNFKSILQFMDKEIPSSGDGLSAASPQKILFMVSDGTNDSYDCAYSNGNTCRRITPIDTQKCQAMKARGVRIAVLYTTYLPLPTNSFYNTYLAKYVAAPSQLASAMQTCASPGLYFEVSPSEGISDAMSTLFNKVVSVVRINS